MRLGWHSWMGSYLVLEKSNTGKNPVPKSQVQSLFFHKVCPQEAGNKHLQ